jgi:glucose/arabinose dehydrogenase
MRRLTLNKTLLFCVVGFCLFSMTCSTRSQSNSANETKTSPCPSDDTGLTIPAGFCATVFADGIGHARHLVVGPTGVVYVNTWSGRYYGNDVPHAGGFLVALQDNTGAGKADVIERFGETAQTGGAGGTGIGMYKGSIYAEINDRIVRYALPAGSVVPRDAPETIVSGLPLTGDHPMHPFIIDADGSMYVDVASATNSCQPKNRQPKSPGASPCTELTTRGGIWRYDANKWTLLARPTPASRKTANQNRPAQAPAPNLPPEAASGVMTPIRRTRSFHPRNGTRRGYATLKALPSIPQAGYSSPNTDEINCTQIGPISTSLTKKLPCPRKSCCF